MSRRWKIGLVAGGLVIAGAATAVVVQKKKGKVTEVTVARAVRQDIVGKVTANGKIQAETKVDLSALVMGQIVNLVVTEGDVVRKGDLLLQIDPNRAAAEEAGASAALRASRADLASARASLEQAERDFARAEANYQAKIVPIAEFQRARAALDTTRAAWESAQNRVEQFQAALTASKDTLAKTTVRAPIDGIITTLRVKSGEVTVLGTMNNPGTQLMTISDLSGVLAVLMVDETEIPTVAVGQKAVLTLDSYPGRAFAGEVTEVGHSPIERSDPDLQGLITTSDAINFKVRVKLSAPPPGIRPGFSVTADIITATREKVLAVPLAALVIRDDPDGKKDVAGRTVTETGVYRLVDGKVRFSRVETGVAGELQIEVGSGLAEGDEIVSGPFKALREIKDGDAVKRAPETRPGAEKPAAG